MAKVLYFKCGLTMVENSFDDFTVGDWQNLNNEFVCQIPISSLTHELYRCHIHICAELETIKI